MSTRCRTAPISLLRASLLVFAVVAATGMAASRAARADATASTTAPLDLRIGQVRPVSASLESVDSARVPSGVAAVLEGVLQVRPAEVAGAGSVTIQWNALRVGSVRKLLDPAPLSTFEILSSDLPAGAAITLQGNSAQLRSAIEQLSGLSFTPLPAAPAPTPASSVNGGNAGINPASGSAALNSSASDSSTASGLASTTAGETILPTASTPVYSTRPTPNYATAGTASGTGMGATTSRPTPDYSSTATAGGTGSTPTTLSTVSPLALMPSSSSGSTSSNAGATQGSSGSSTSADTATADTATADTATADTATADTGTADTGTTDTQTAGDTGSDSSGATNTTTVTAAADTSTSSVADDDAPIGTDRVSCEPHVDDIARTVTNTYRRYRIAPDGAPTYIDAACVDDPATLRQLDVTAEGCGFLINPVTMEATQLERFVFEHPASGLSYHGVCLLFDGAPSYPIAMTLAGCRLQHLWDQARTIGLIRPVFEVDGTTISAGGCAQRDDYPSVYPHIVEACADLTVEVLGVPRTFAQSRTLIATSPPRELVPCEPTATDTVVSTGEGGALHVSASGDGDARDLVDDGCDAIYVHDLDARVSYGTRRWYLKLVQGLEVGSDLIPITDCVLDPRESYDQAYVPTGWTFDDTTRYSRQKYDAIVTLPGHGDVTVATGIEPDPPIPYNLTGWHDTDGDGVAQVGCDVYRQRRRMDTYARADGSSLELDGGTETPILVSSCRPSRASRG